MTQERCHECEACRRVAATQRLALPSPPFTHASDHVSLVWNQVLADNPCERWDAESRQAFYLRLSQVSEAIRPNLPITT